MFIIDHYIREIYKKYKENGEIYYEFDGGSGDFYCDGINKGKKATEKSIDEYIRYLKSQKKLAKEYKKILKNKELLK